MLVLVAEVAAKQQQRAPWWQRYYFTNITAYLGYILGLSSHVAYFELQEDYLARVSIWALTGEGSGAEALGHPSVKF